MSLARRSFLKALIGAPFAAPAIERLIANGVAASPVVPVKALTTSRVSEPPFVTSFPARVSATWTSGGPAVIYRPGDVVYLHGHPIGRCAYSSVCSTRDSTESTTEIALSEDGERVLTKAVIDRTLPDALRLHVINRSFS